MTPIATNKKSALFFTDLEKKAASYPVRNFKVTAKDRSLLGLFLMHDDAKATDVEAALTQLAASFTDIEIANDIDDKFNSTDISQPGPLQLKKILRTELDRVQLTRMPCSLILLETDAATPAIEIWEKELLEAIKECLHHADILVRRSNHEFAVILPGTNLGKSIMRANKIRKATLATDTATRMGIAICYANDHFTPDNFLAMAEEEIIRTRQLGAEPICHVSGIRAEDTCQVSVEERAQLFGFLVKDTN